jgi:hypothetical protein
MGPVNRAMRLFRAALVTPVAAGGCDVAASGLSRAAFVRAAVLRQMVALHPYEPLMAQGLATLAACRAAMKSGKAVDDALVRRLDALIEALHLLAEVELR